MTFYLALLWTVLLVFNNLEIKNSNVCPENSIVSFVQSSSYEMLVFNLIIMFWSMSMYEKMFGVKQASKYLFIFSGFIITTEFLFNQVSSIFHQQARLDDTPTTS